MSFTTPPHFARSVKIAGRSSLALGLAAVSFAGNATAGAAAPAAAPASADAAIPYLTVLPARAVRSNGDVVHGRIQLRAIIAADGLPTKWSIRVIKRSYGHIVHRVIAHGTLAPTATKTVTAVATGVTRTALTYDVTASNSDGGQPTPPQHARIA